MWDERYSSEEYAYGTQPNEFLAANFADITRGRVLSLAEGEGRNAVFLAQQGFSVTAVDSSLVGLAKAKKLADKHGVSIELVHADLADYDLGESKWDGIISIFNPLPSALRAQLHNQVVGALKANGVFLLEAYTPKQLQFATGGGNSLDVMQSKESLQAELKALEFTHLLELERIVVEGIYHTGKGAVVQAIACKTL
ncbi:class I SAM-dependent methyltransferase [Agarivorans sp. TSD2052]|uniref:class I SAM-dependent methyltransferase n=1 Tax=Agarivorans sp. TSD2052 TaxID=2937286 RepID=UPI00200BCBFA|nr:class I SAM-dependent methyltransferase [Agarivorans sp. TSD2052]UPW17874.1 class I SAM-dependent methyltransferase [Agarivorans sp. TSD2052]